MESTEKGDLMGTEEVKQFYTVRDSGAAPFIKPGDLLIVKAVKRDAPLCLAAMRQSSGDGGSESPLCIQIIGEVTELRRTIAPEVLT